MPIREIDMGSSREQYFEYTQRGKRVGAIHLAKVKRGGRMVWTVRGINVLAEARRKGIGTKLWEHAAREACRLRAPLASDERVGSGASEAFWQKQLRKGRARVLCKRCGTGGQPVYVLDCPAPKSLKGTLR